MEPLNSIDTSIQPRPAGCPVPLTAYQLRMWNRISRQGTPLSIRFPAASVRLLGRLNVSDLRRSIESVVQRHESLRTRIVLVDGTPRQHIETDFRFSLEVIDLTAILSKDIEAEATRLVHMYLHERIDLSVGPLFEGKLLKLSSREHVLILGLDHIVCDGASNMILSREIWSLYEQAARGQALLLPQLPIQFADYAVWQQRTFDAWLTTHGPYWRERLSCAPHIKLTREASDDIKHPILESLHFPIGKMITTSLRDVARRQRTHLSSVVLAIYVSLLSRWCDQDDLVLGFVSHGRNRPELAHMIGFISTHLYIRITIAKQDTFLDLLNKINLQLHDAQSHQDYDRVPDLFYDDSPGVLFNWVPTQWSPIDWTQWSVHQRRKLNNQLEMQPFPIQLQSNARGGPCPFMIMMAPSDTIAGIILTLFYRSDLFTLSRVESFCTNIRLFSAEFAERPFTSVASLALTP